MSTLEERARETREMASAAVCAIQERTPINPQSIPERMGKGESWDVAVKVNHPRGNEGLRVLAVKD